MEIERGLRAIFAVFFFLTAPAFGQEASGTDEIVIKSTDAVMTQVNANMKLTQDQVDAIRPVIMDNTAKIRDLQLSLENGAIDSKAMYDQRKQLNLEEDQELSRILTPDQMKVWMNIHNS